MNQADSDDPAAPRSDALDPLDAGGFSAWLSGMQLALGGTADSDVPCGTCTACCASSQFVHLGPDEADALAHIPDQLLFPAPGLPPGHLLMGYDERGHCPMLTDGACTIYEHRPRTCRTYDCRIFPATGVDPAGDKPLIAERAARWRFDVSTAADQTLLAAVRAAGSFVRHRSGELPDRLAPTTPTQQAVLAVEIHEAFVATDPATGQVTVVSPEPAEVAVAIGNALRP